MKYLEKGTHTQRLFFIIGFYVVFVLLYEQFLYLVLVLFWPQFILFCILANLSPDVVKNLPDELQTGIYFGWANVDNGEIYKAVLSLGWNPFFKNKEKSLVIQNKFNFNLGDNYMWNWILLEITDITAVSTERSVESYCHQNKCLSICRIITVSFPQQLHPLKDKSVRP